mmetsp:Transcript_42051/g.77837  ORF Transcript_42051/g.77837 Transcript_42051/m.77837 type:complete len:118 (+) Transcript_42051:187-540(+)
MATISQKLNETAFRFSLVKRRQRHNYRKKGELTAQWHPSDPGSLLRTRAVGSIFFPRFVVHLPGTCSKGRGPSTRIGAGLGEVELIWMDGRTGIWSMELNPAGIGQLGAVAGDRMEL